MKLQELVNKLSNLLACGAGDAEVKIDGKPIEVITLTEEDGVKVVSFSSRPTVS